MPCSFALTSKLPSGEAARSLSCLFLRVRENKSPEFVKVNKLRIPLSHLRFVGGSLRKSTLPSALRVNKRRIPLSHLRFVCGHVRKSTLPWQIRALRGLLASSHSKKEERENKLRASRSACFFSLKEYRKRK